MHVHSARAARLRLPAGGRELRQIVHSIVCEALHDRHVEETEAEQHATTMIHLAETVALPVEELIWWIDSTAADPSPQNWRDYVAQRTRR